MNTLDAEVHRVLYPSERILDGVTYLAPNEVEYTGPVNGVVIGRHTWWPVDMLDSDGYVGSYLWIPDSSYGIEPFRSMRGVVREDGHMYNKMAVGFVPPYSDDVDGFALIPQVLEALWKRGLVPILLESGLDSISLAEALFVGEHELAIPERLCRMIVYETTT